jgi:hypothetical protein
MIASNMMEHVVFIQWRCRVDANLFEHGEDKRSYTIVGTTIHKFICGYDGSANSSHG